MRVCKLIFVFALFAAVWSEETTPQPTDQFNLSGFSQGAIAVPENKLSFRNGFDPLYNQMVAGPMKGYIDSMHFKISNLDAYRRAFEEVRRAIPFTSSGVSGVVEPPKVATTTTDSGVTTPQSGVTEQVQSGVSDKVTTGVSSDVQSGVTNDVPSGVTNDVPSGVTNDVPSDVKATEAEKPKDVEVATDKQPSGVSDLAASGERELPSGMDEPNEVIMNNYIATQGIFSVPIGLREPADYWGAGDDEDQPPAEGNNNESAPGNTENPAGNTENSAGNTENSAGNTENSAGNTEAPPKVDVSTRQAPFRVVNDSTKNRLNELALDLGKLRTGLDTNKKGPLAATNPEDEKALADINSKKVPASPKVVKRIEEAKTKAAHTGDPFEINVLHRIGEKMRRIQDAVTRTALHEQAVANPKTAALQQLVNNVKAMRKQAEHQYQKHPLNTFANDEKRLIRMEKLYRKMENLGADRSLDPQQFNRLASVYRDRLRELGQ